MPYNLYLVHTEHASAVLVTRDKKAASVYAVQELPEPTEGSREFLLLKVTGKRSEFGPYCVTVPVDPYQPGECSCVGWGRWKSCKHIESLHDAVHERKLPNLKGDDEKS